MNTQWFMPRMYQRATMIGFAAVITSLLLDQKQVALGLAAGLALALFSTWTIEMAVRLMSRVGALGPAGLLVAGFVKLPMLGGALLGVAWAGYNGHLNVFAAVGGMLIVHAVMLTMFIAAGVSAGPSKLERYR